MVSFDQLSRADLVVDATYEGGRLKHAGDDPLDPLLRVGNQGGIRFRGSPTQDDVRLLALYTTLADPVWPDVLDVELGRLVYYGDNKVPGQGLEATRRQGNIVLRAVFDRLHGMPEARAKIPPTFVFTKAGRGRDVIFRGLAVPGAPGVAPDEDLVAIWRTIGGNRFQNYRATFTILDAPLISRAWLDMVIAGTHDLTAAPPAWRDWVQSGRYRPLLAPSARPFRTKAEQVPDAQDRPLVQALIDHFPVPTDFEPCAAALWTMASGRTEYTMTRPSVDGGRDAFGFLRIGPEADPVLLDFALEAKRYAIDSGVGVKELARLISRIRHRMFGVLVTTSFLDRQAYQELRSDGHPIVVLAGRDIVALLKQDGISTVDEVKTWLAANFPNSASAARTATYPLADPADLARAAEEPAPYGD